MTNVFSMAFPINKCSLAVAQSEKRFFFTVIYNIKLNGMSAGKNKLTLKVKKDNAFILYFACKGEL